MPVLSVGIELPVRVAYDCDPELAMAALLDAPRGIARILTDFSQ